MSKKVITVDVRDDLKRGREPFSKIMHTVSGLKENEDLLLIAPFEPAPLFGVLAQHGFSHQARTNPDGDWEVLFTRNPIDPTAPKPANPAPGPEHAPCAGTPVLEVDTRGLEPPQPLVKILEAVATLPQGVALRALTQRRPMHLYAPLEERGFVGDTEEQKDGSFITHIRRR